MRKQALVAFGILAFAVYVGSAAAHSTGFPSKGRVVPGKTILKSWAEPFSLVWSGPGIRTFTATADRSVVEGEPTLFEIWVCADGYWCDHTKNLVPGELTERYRELEAGLMGVYEDAVAP